MARKKQQTESFYVTIKDPVHFRKELLYTIKDSLSLLKEYNRMLAIRDQKQDLAKKLQEQYAAIATLYGELATLLPRTPGARREATAKPTVTAPRKDEQMVPIKRSELDLIDDELKKVEEELKRLS